MINYDYYVYVLMGVLGSGKFVVVSVVVYQFYVVFLDGDFLYLCCNIEKMVFGELLNDDDCKLWLQVLNDVVFVMQCINKILLIVCFVLKKYYCDLLCEGNLNFFFIYLKGDFDVIESCLKVCKGYFFKIQMLVMQFEML